MTRGISVLGAGGHAKVVIATLLAGGRNRLWVFDDDPSRWGGELLGVPIAGPIESAAEDVSTPAIVAVGDNRTRAELAARYALEWTSAVHPSAVVHPSVAIGPGTLVCAGAVLQPGTRLGEHVIVNTSAAIDHDCRVGDFAHVAPGASVAGDVRIGAGTLVGIGSCVLPGVAVGSWTTVGAGAAVTRDLPARCTAVGVPARVLGASK